jgi:hypothetical protein
MDLTEEQKKWASKRRQGAPAKILGELLIKQEGRCVLSKVKMIFDNIEGTPVAGGRGCHPLYPAVDHKDPGNPEGGYQIVCYALNDLKGHLPPDCFKALTETDAWKNLMQKWAEQAKKDNMDREAFRRLLRPNATPEKRRTTEG